MEAKQLETSHLFYMALKRDCFGTYHQEFISSLGKNGAMHTSYTNLTYLLHADLTPCGIGLYWDKIGLG